MIKAIIFDWGGVLIDDPAPGLFAYCARALNVTAKEFHDAFAENEDMFQKGQIEEPEFWENICTKLDRPLPNNESLWGDAFADSYRPKDELFGLAAKFKSDGYKTAFLSNTEKPAMKFFYTKNYDMFDEIIFSCAVGMIKPEVNIFELTLDKLSVRPEEAVFVDDREKYLAGSKKVGIHSILFKNYDQLKPELKKLGINIE